MPGTVAGLSSKVHQNSLQGRENVRAIFSPHFNPTGDITKSRYTALPIPAPKWRTLHDGFNPEWLIQAHLMLEGIGDTLD
ncbi:MAG: hypothetical protein L0Y57_03695 [Beijerinckiaceae bacterium]|nr:hypothetical protein [Beijerinckiaceae bacterium]